MTWTGTLVSWLAEGPSIYPGVTQVVLTDRTPFTLASGDVSWWDARSKILFTDPADLPHDLFTLLSSHNLSVGYYHTHRSYPARDDALADLSSACLAWAAARLKEKP